MGPASKESLPRASLENPSTRTDGPDRAWGYGPLSIQSASELSKAPWGGGRTWVGAEHRMRRPRRGWALFEVYDPPLAEGKPSVKVRGVSELPPLSSNVPRFGSPRYSNGAQTDKDFSNPRNKLCFFPGASAGPRPPIVPQAFFFVSRESPHLRTFGFRKPGQSPGFGFNNWIALAQAAVWGIKLPPPIGRPPTARL